jgi:hypothetical protein
MVEKSFFEYHLYTLTRPTTIADKETKQLEMVSGAGLGMRRSYVYDPTANPTAALVVSEMENTEANGLGKPLPKGVVRLYAPDPDGVQTYVAQTGIDHTPVKEKLRLPWGHAFDIACSWRETDAKHAGYDHHITAECSLRNHKDHPVTVTVIVHVPPGTYQAECKLPWHVREVGLVEVTADIPAGTETKFTFSYKFNNLSGGGLKSPHDQESRDLKLSDFSREAAKVFSRPVTLPGAYALTFTHIFAGRPFGTLQRALPRAAGCRPGPLALGIRVSIIPLFVLFCLSTLPACLPRKAEALRPSTILQARWKRAKETEEKNNRCRPQAQGQRPWSTPAFACGYGGQGTLKRAEEDRQEMWAKGRGLAPPG